MLILEASEYTGCAKSSAMNAGGGRWLGLFDTIAPSPVFSSNLVDILNEVYQII
jgi:hypothetical protein